MIMIANPGGDSCTSPMNGKPAKTKRQPDPMSEITSGTVTPEMLEILARDFALFCRTLRGNLGLKQDAFGAMMGVKNKQAKITISRWESGNHVPQKRYLIKFLALQSQYDKSRKVS